MDTIILTLILTGVAALVLPYVFDEMRKKRRKRSPKVARGLIS